MSSIEWTDRTWNPVVGCTRVSEGCRHCYAETMAARQVAMGTKGYEGIARGGASEPGSGKPARWAGKVRLLPERLGQPARWRKPQRVFVNSMSDLFHEALTNEEIAAVFGAMAAAPHHTFQVLTKRPARMLEWFRWVSDLGARQPSLPSAEEGLCRLFAWVLGELEQTILGVGSRGEYRWPLPNVWLGVSVEDQSTADERIPLLLECPAAVRFVSYEPALGPVDFEPWYHPRCRGCGQYTHYDPHPATGPGGYAYPCGPVDPALDQLILGGESGPRARPCDVRWLSEAALAARDAGVAVFVKQLGSRPVDHGRPIKLRDRKGGDPGEWPADVPRWREFPV